MRGHETMSSFLKGSWRRLRHDQSGSIAIIFALSLFLGQAVGVTAFGAIMDRFGYPGPFVATGVLLAMLAWLFRRFLKTHPIGKSQA